MQTFYDLFNYYLLILHMGLITSLFIIFGSLFYFLCTENSVFGVRSVIDQANDFLKCAIEHPHLFQTPEVR